LSSSSRPAGRAVIRLPSLLGGANKCPVESWWKVAISLFLSYSEVNK
jgi:hypothetical protein